MLNTKSTVVMYEGSKFFIHINRSLKVFIVNHVKSMVFEVIVSYPHSFSELARLYIDSNKLNSRISFEHDKHISLLINFQDARRTQLSFNVEEITSQVITSMSVAKMLELLEVSLNENESVANNLEVYLKLTKLDESSIVFDQDGDILRHRLDYQCAGLPHGLIPFQILHKKLRLSIPEKIINLHRKEEVSTPTTATSCTSNDTISTNHSSVQSISHSTLSPQKLGYFERFLLSFKRTKKYQIAPSDSAKFDDVNKECDVQTHHKMQTKPGAIHSLRNMLIG